jgi:GT2 family glycosyltransferase
VSTPALSLLVATRDRAPQLARFLARLPAVEIGAAGAEVVIVDNGSSDDTPRVLAEFAATAPFPLTLLADPRPGKSAALNDAVARCRADLVGFTDDDCYLAPGWFDVALREFASGAIGFAGGRVLLHDPADSRVATSFSRRRRVLRPGAFIRAGLVQGANMVMTRRAFEAAGGFDPAFGPGLAFRCEDVDLVARASFAGVTGAYLPALVVYHHHGRKPGAEALALRRQNAHGRGACYLKCILRGQHAYALGWAWRSAAPWRWRFIPQELRGARDWLRARRAAG